MIPMDDAINGLRFLEDTYPKIEREFRMMVYLAYLEAIGKRRDEPYIVQIDDVGVLAGQSLRITLAIEDKP